MTAFLVCDETGPPKQSLDGAPSRVRENAMGRATRLIHQAGNSQERRGSTLRTWERKRGGGGAAGVCPPTSPSRLLNPPTREPAYLFGEPGIKQVVLVRLFASVIGFDGGEHHRVERIKTVAEVGSALVQKVAYFNG